MSNVLEFEARMKDLLSAQATKIVEAFEKITVANKKTKTSLEQTAESIKKIGAALTKIAIPIGVAKAAVIKFGSDFDQAMVSSLAIMGDVSDAMRTKMEVSAREMAKTSTFSATKIAQSYLFLASAGLSAEQSLSAISVVTKFAQAGNFELEKATSLLTDSQSSLGLAVSDTVQNMTNMVRISDVLVEAGNRSNGSVQQFSEALTNKAGAALRMLGKDLEEGVAVLSVFADQGLKGDAAGESLAIVMRDLQRAAIENRDAFKGAGISVFDASGDMRGMADIVGELENRLRPMSDEQKRAELMLLGFQDRSVAATLSLIGMSGKIRDYERALRSAGGATNEVAAKQLESFQSKMALIKNRLTDVTLVLWEKMQPILEKSVIPLFDKAVKVLAVVVEWFGKLPVSVQKFTFMAAALVVVLAPVVVALGAILAVAVPLAPVIGTVAAAIGSVIVPATMAAAGISALIAIFGNLMGAMKSAKEKSREKIFEGIKEDINNVEELRMKSYQLLEAKRLIDKDRPKANAPQIKILTKEEMEQQARDILTITARLQEDAARLNSQKRMAAAKSDYDRLRASFEEENALRNIQYQQEYKQLDGNLKAQQLLKQSYDTQNKAASIAFSNEVENMRSSQIMSIRVKLAEDIAKLESQKKTLGTTNEFELLKIKFDEEAAIRVAKYQQEYDQLNGNLQAQALLKQSFDAQNKAAQITYSQEFQSIEQEQYNKTIELHQKATDNFIKNKQKERAAMFAAKDQFLANLQTMSGQSKFFFNLYKTAAIAQATVDTYKGATSAYSSLAGIPVVGPVLGGIAAAAAVTAGLLNVQKIQQQRFAYGGIVGGNNFTGDKQPVMANSGEMFLNGAQQARLLSIANGNTTHNSVSASSSPQFNFYGSQGGYDREEIKRQLSDDVDGIIYEAIRSNKLQRSLAAMGR